jgi:hypothetical protein
MENNLCSSHHTLYHTQDILLGAAPLHTRERATRSKEQTRLRQHGNKWKRRTLEAAAAVAKQAEVLLDPVVGGYNIHSVVWEAPKGMHVAANQGIEYREVDCSNAHTRLRTRCCRTCMERECGTSRDRLDNYSILGLRSSCHSGFRRSKPGRGPRHSSQCCLLRQATGNHPRESEAEAEVGRVEMVHWVVMVARVVAVERWVGWAARVVRVGLPVALVEALGRVVVAAADESNSRPAACPT